MSMSMSGLKKTFVITTNTPFQVQDLLTISQYQKNSKKCYWVTSTFILEKLGNFPKSLPRSFSKFQKKRRFLKIPGLLKGTLKEKGRIISFWR